MNADELERAYLAATMGLDEPDYAIFSTPFGPVELSRGKATGDPRAITYLNDLMESK